MTTTTFLTDGVYLHGEFYGMFPGSVFTGKDGVSHSPWKVRLLTSQGQMTVEYESREHALGALGSKDGVAPDRLAQVALPVYVNGPWDKAAGKRGSVFFKGRTLRDERETA